MHRFAKERRAHLVLLAFSCLFFFRLGVRPFWDPDEGRYAEISREMLELHDFVTPHLNYTRYFEKPPLLFWLVAGSFKLFGEREWAGRAIPALAALFGIFLTYWFGQKFLGSAWGLYSAAILATSFGYALFARVLLTDILFSALLAAALFFAFTCTESRKRNHLLAFYFFLALATLAKGPVAVVLAGLVLFFFCLTSSQPRTLLFFLNPLGLGLFLLIASPWFVLAAKHNREFLWFFFVHEHILRYATKEAHRYQPFGYFFIILPLFFWPWTFYLPSAFSRFQRASKRSSDTLRLFTFLLCWIFCIFLFFSFSQSKLPTYILPIFPALSLLAAGAFSPLAHLSKQNGSLEGKGGAPRSLGYPWLYVLFHTLFSGALGLALLSLLHSPRYASLGTSFHQAAAFALLGILLGWAVVVIGHFLRNPWAFCSVVLLSLFFFLPLVFLSEPLSVNYSTKMLSAKLRPLLKSTDRILLFRDYKQSVNFYTKRRAAIFQGISELQVNWMHEKKRAWFPETREDLARLARSHRLFIFVPPREKDNFHSFLPPKTELRFLGKIRRFLLFEAKASAEAPLS